jgi:hypothetical protein
LFRKTSIKWALLFSGVAVMVLQTVLVGVAVVLLLALLM